MHETEIWMQKLYNLHTKSCVFLVCFSVFFVCSWHFLLIILYAYALFPFRSFPHFCACFPKCLRLEFHVNQRGLMRHNWSTSSWLIARPLANQRGGAVTSLQRASLAADVQRSLVQVENGLLSAGQHLFIQDNVICGHMSLLYVYLAIRLTLNELSPLCSPIFIYYLIAKGSSHNMHRPREVTVICACPGCDLWKKQRWGCFWKFSWNVFNDKNSINVIAV